MLLHSRCFVVILLDTLKLSQTERDNTVISENVGPEPQSVAGPERQPAGDSPGGRPEADEQGPVRVTVVPSAELSRYERNYLAVTRLAAFGAILAAVFVYFQFKGLVDQNRILSAQAQSAAAGATLNELNVREQLKLLREQVEAAQNSVKAVQSQMRQDQRAWVTIEVKLPEKIISGQPLSGKATIKNTGKTDARRIVAEFVAKTVENGKQPSFTYPAPHSRTTTGHLVPASPLEMPVEWVHFKAGTKEGTPVLLTSDEVNELRGGK